MGQPKEFPSMLAMQMTHDAVHGVKETLKSIIGNEELLLRVVSAGEHHWMVSVAPVFAGMAVDDQVLHDMFKYLKARAGPEPGKQLDALLKAKDAEASKSNLATGGNLDDIVEN